MSKLIQVFVFAAYSVCAFGAEPSKNSADPVETTGRELFRDVRFANGFGEGSYAAIDMRPLKSRPIPDDGKVKAWEFAEGIAPQFYGCLLASTSMRSTSICWSPIIASR